MPLKSGKLTNRERAFVGRCVEAGDPVAAARAVGYAQPAAAANQLMARPAVAEEVRKREAERITNDLLPLAVERVERVLRDDKAEYRHVLAAAKLVWDRALGAENGQIQKEPHEMTADELAARITRLRQRQAELAGAAIDVTPQIETSDEGVFD